MKTITKKRDGSRTREVLRLRHEEQLPWDAVAARLGITRGTAKNMARVGLSARFLDREDEIARTDVTPGCGRCGLRGEHVCIPDSAAAYAELRNGAGAVYPEGNEQ